MKKNEVTEVTKTSYNIFKIWGAINLILGFAALYVGYVNGDFLSLVLAAIGVILGGILITISKGSFVVKRTVKVNVDDTI